MTAPKVDFLKLINSYKKNYFEIFLEIKNPHTRPMNFKHFDNLSQLFVSKFFEKSHLHFLTGCVINVVELSNNIVEFEYLIF